MPEHTPAPTPARSLYGFFMYLFFKTALTLYCIWAFIPDYYLHYINIYYYPQKYWAVAVPIQVLVALTLFAFLIYPCLNFILMTSIDSINTITDIFTQSISQVTSKGKQKELKKNACVCLDNNKCMVNDYVEIRKQFYDSTLLPVSDINIRFVCKKLYLNKN